jgi:Fur family ferric uptake transcriptional regulator
MAEYATEQKKMLLDFLTKNAHQAFSVDELVSGMKNTYADGVPGISTVYRLMTKLVDEGTVKRFVKGHSRCFVYQIVDGTHCRSHLHLKCMECGKLLHLDDGVSDALLNQIRANNDFSVNEEETVLFGECSACAHRKS